MPKLKLKGGMPKLKLKGRMPTKKSDVVEKSKNGYMPIETLHIEHGWVQIEKWLYAACTIIEHRMTWQYAD